MLVTQYLVEFMEKTFATFRLLTTNSFFVPIPVGMIFNDNQHQQHFLIYNCNGKLS